MYRTPAIHVSVTGVFTNSSPTGPYRGAGRPEASYVLERMVDIAAHRLKLDPAAIRRANLIPSSAMPFRTALTYTYDCGEFEQVMDRCLESADYRGFPGRRLKSRSDGKLRGLGLAMVIERATLAPSIECVEIGFSAAGSVDVYAGSTDQGQGHATMYVQLVSGLLGLAPEHIRVTEGDTRKLSTGGMTGSSRVSTMGSAATKLAAMKVIAKAKRVAAHFFEVSESDVFFDDGAFTVVGTDLKLDWTEIARAAHSREMLPREIEPGLTEQATYRLETQNYPNGAHVCELEIDPETGAIDLLRYTVVDDVGTVINPLLVKGQIHGGIAQGCGEALMEEIVYDRDSGQLLTGSFMDYCMPRSDRLCSYEVSNHPVPTSTNPLGVKGVGEAGTVGALPAVMNAGIDALKPYGIEHIDMPATGEKLWQAMRRARSSPEER